MAKLNNLPKIKTRSQKRVGRGYGSGKGGHTAGRGAKGAKARGKVGLTFEGTKTKKSLIRRLPLRRGKGKFKSIKPRPMIINLKVLDLFSQGSVVTTEALVKKGLIYQKDLDQAGVKVLGGGPITKALTVKIPCSQGAIKQIEKAGGKVVLEKPSLAKKQKKSQTKGKKKAPAAKKPKETKS